jgi:hypothetical protein
MANGRSRLIKALRSRSNNGSVVARAWVALWLEAEQDGAREWCQGIDSFCVELLADWFQWNE